jgi:hypothetical protein
MRRHSCPVSPYQADDHEAGDDAVAQIFSTLQSELGR